jgi:hypothetical protein
MSLSAWAQAHVTPSRIVPEIIEILSAAGIEEAVELEDFTREDFREMGLTNVVPLVKLMAALDKHPPWHASGKTEVDADEEKVEVEQQGQEQQSSPLAGSQSSSDAALVQRMFSVSFEDGQDRSPLAPLFTGLEVPATLEEAVQPLFDAGVAPANLRGFLPHVRASVQQKAALREPPYDSLPAAQKEAIALYTYEDLSDKTQSPFFVMNKCLRERRNLQAWKHYVWLLLHGLNELPAERVDTVFRGCDQTAETLPREMVEKGEVFTFSQFGSTATTLDVVDGFVGSTVRCGACD